MMSLKTVCGAGLSRWPSTCSVTRDRTLAAAAPDVVSARWRVGWLWCELLWAPPALLLLYLILHYPVDFPSADQWDFEVPFLQKVGDGSVTLHDFVALQVEHRLVTNRVAAFLLDKCSLCSVRLNFVMNWLLTCACAVVFCILGRRTLSGGNGRRAVVAFLAGALLFAPSKYSLWLNGDTPFALTFVQIMVLLGLLTAGSRWRTALRFPICMILALVSTYSNGNGMAAWVVFLPALLLPASGKELRRQLPWIVAWGALACVSVASYFNFGNFQPATNIIRAPSVVEFSYPVQFALFVLTALGSPFAMGTAVEPKIVGILAGSVVLLLYGTACICAILYRKDGPFLRKVLPWLMLGAFAVITCLAIARGRADTGIAEALESRYLMWPALAVIALVYLVPIVLEHTLRQTEHDTPDRATSTAPAATSPAAAPAGGKSRFRWNMTPGIARGLTSALATTLVISQVCYSVNSLQMYETFRIMYTSGKAAALFLPCFAEESLLRFPIWSRPPKKMQPELEFLVSKGYFKPALIRSARIHDLLGSDEQGLGTRGNFGALMSASPSGRTALTVQGWAVFPGRKRPADAVVLTWETSGREAMVFAIATMGLFCEEVANKLGNSGYRRCGWVKNFDTGFLPPGPITLRAWAFDTASGKAFELSGAITFQH